MGLTQINAYPNIDNKSVDFDPKNKVEVAIARIRQFVPPEGYLFSDSYGKDSCLVRDLMKKSGVKYETHYSRTGIDPPELVYFGRKFHDEAIIDKPPMTIWKAMLLPAYGTLPQRQMRWCCALLKEQVRGGFIVMGIRWQESLGRRGKRRLFEVCRKDGTTFFLNPIIDWTDREVWEYIHQNNIPYCSLYD